MERIQPAPLSGDRQIVLFLCTGNFYRSRFAEIYFNWLARRDNLTYWTADSRGLALDPLNSGPLSIHTRRYLEQLAIPLPEPLRMPQDAAECDFRAAQRIVALKEDEHRPLMRRRFPAWADHVEYWRVHDLDFALPTEALPQVKAHIDELFAKLLLGSR
jgi:protein-tyrosine phosphatase